jgi:hypothetical protein
MALEKLKKDLAIISKLGDQPGADNGLTTAQLKAKFDEAALAIKDYINNYLIPQLDNIVDVDALLNNILDTKLATEGKAAEAKATGEAIAKALSKSGGTMTGDIDMGSKMITNLSDPVNGGDAANKQYVDGKHLPLTVNLLTASWIGDDAPYTQTVTVQGILETDEPHYGVVYSEDQDTRLAQKEAFALVDDLITTNGNLTFVCFEEKPGTDLTIHLEVNR